MSVSSARSLRAPPRSTRIRNELAKQFEVVGLPDVRFLNVDRNAAARLEQRLDPELFAAELEALIKLVESK